jgi:hypothetical protein
LFPRQLANGGPSFQLAANCVSPPYIIVFDLPIVLGRNFTGEEARAGLR